MATSSSNNSTLLINQLFSIRNLYGKNYAAQKIQLLHAVSINPVNNKKSLQLFYGSLLFLLAYPDNKSVYNFANKLLLQLQLHIQTNEKIKERLFNSGITGSSLSAAFSFEMVKWLKATHAKDIRFNSFVAGDGQIQSILSVLMPKVESEILQDANANWRGWLKQSMKKEEILLDKLVAVFDESTIRPEVKDELWAAIGINIEIDFSSHCCLPPSLFTTYYHRSAIKKNVHQQPASKPILIKLDKPQAEKIIDCSKMILVRHLRELDPITFTSANLVSYYQLTRGISVALLGMIPERRHPIDSYMGYVVFKNGLPVAYAGSWILFNSGRIGLNVFPAYRGGESQYIFQQVLQQHSKVYGLKRFSVDPYQLGKENSDGIKSGAFWVYYHAGFRPICKEQNEIAAEEALKIKSITGYRSPSKVLKQLADSRMELLLQKSTVRFDATDLSLAYATIVKEEYNNNRKLATENNLVKLAQLLQIKNYQEPTIKFILENWSVLLLSSQKNIKYTNEFKKILKNLFELKAAGSEELYIFNMQQAVELRKLLENLLK